MNRLKPPSGWNAASNNTNTRGERRLFSLSVVLAGVLLTTIASSPAQLAHLVSLPPTQQIANSERLAASGFSGSSGLSGSTKETRQTTERSSQFSALTPLSSPSPSPLPQATPLAPRGGEGKGEGALATAGSSSALSFVPPAISHKPSAISQPAAPKLDTSFGRLLLSFEPNQERAMTWRSSGIL